MKNFLLLVAVFCLSYVSVNAQLKTPSPSPMAKVEQVVGLTTINIEYSRPGMKDRAIFGSLVPYGKIWRTGANASAKVSFSEDVMIGGEVLEAGKYALYTIPGENEWTIIFHNNLTHWGVGGYDEAEDAMRVTAEAVEITPAVESFTIDIDNIRNSGATLDLAWENTLVSLPFEVMTDKQVTASIQEVMAGPSAQDYYSAARYYFEEGKEGSKALEWINKSIEIGGERFWVLRLKSLIQASLNDYDAAIKTAQRSAELAEEDGNMNYVKMNEASIEEWKSKM